MEGVIGVWAGVIVHVFYYVNSEHVIEYEFIIQ